MSGSHEFFRLVIPLGCLAVALAPAWWRTIRSWTESAAGAVTALVPVVAIVLAVALLRREPRGPMINDRQTDLILAVAAAAGAVELLLLARRAGAGSLVMAGAACLMAVAIITVGWGTRALWQVRWAIALLLLLWQAPWAVTSERLWPVARSLALIVGDQLPGVATLASGRLSVSSGGTSVALDPAAGSSVLSLTFAGILVGLAYSTLQPSRSRWAMTVLIGTGAGAALAVATWVVAVSLTLIAGEAGAQVWVSGELVAAIEIGGTAAACLLVGWKWFRQGFRRTGDPRSILLTRLSRAVPRMTVATIVIGVFCTVFVLLQNGVTPDVSGAPMPESGALPSGRGATR